MKMKVETVDGEELEINSPRGGNCNRCGSVLELAKVKRINATRIYTLWLCPKRHEDKRHEDKRYHFDFVGGEWLYDHEVFSATTTAF